MSTDLKPGTRVRVTIEGTVGDVALRDDIGFALDSPDAPFLIHVPETAQVEVLAPARRELDHGAYYLWRNNVYRYNAATDVLADSSHAIGVEAFTNEQLASLVRMVPEA